MGALDQPVLVFLLLVGAGATVVVGELLSLGRRIRAGGAGSTIGLAASSGASGLTRRYRITLLAVSLFVLVGSFGSASASFAQQQVSGGLQVDVVFPPNQSGAAPTTAPTDVVGTEPTGAVTPAPGRTLAPGSTRTPAPKPTSSPTRTLAPTPTSASAPTPTDTPSAAPTDAPTPAPTDAPTDAPTPAPTDAHRWASRSPTRPIRRS
jgi:hypothetical protein